ncbi:Flp pilus assembly protein CpaB [Aquisalibacillus elongatus]|uniref:Pilus assembly protein CpaB n=1 Tax=Aquisalibacillus elongatus TaxID=485577 RepID=A0A3N5B997_9BACI|nr:Flp pilus assembly protein CpaB [Aquisalibacillus elongatus]RPF53963.1 pilus assembly protein CpaB [Aquisalibacillus elongatus]
MQSKLLFLLAILMGIITTAIFFYSNQTGEEAPKEEEIPMTEVVVLVEDVTVNQRLSDEDVELKTVPEEQVHESAVTSVEAVQGRFVTADMVAGESVLSHRLKSGVEEQNLISRKIDEDHRAVSISTDMVRSVTNLIYPEDYVDLIFTYGNEGGDQPEHRKLRGTSENLLDQQESVMLLERVRVLSVGKKMSTQNGEAVGEYSEVTLELTPDETVTVVNATQQGSLHLALHSRIVDDEEQEEE